MNRYIIFLFGMFIFQRCDVYRAIRITNYTDKSIEIYTDYPNKLIYNQVRHSENVTYEKGIQYEKDIYNIKERYPTLEVDTVNEGLIFILEPLEYFDIAGALGPIFGDFQEKELYHSKLLIISNGDTIKADNRSGILELLKVQNMQYDKNTDKGKVIPEKGNIVIR